MEKIVRQSLLYDFYGELLTEHQKNIYEDLVNNDLSYSEIANNYGISRQGVYDLIKRCDNSLEEYEEKLKLVDKFLKARGMVLKMQGCISDLKEINKDEETGEKISEIEKLSQDILNEF